MNTMTYESAMKKAEKLDAVIVIPAGVAQPTWISMVGFAFGWASPANRNEILLDLESAYTSIQ